MIIVFTVDAEIDSVVYFDQETNEHDSKEKSFMKKFIAVFICMLCCLGLWSDAVFVAEAVTDINWISTKNAYVGESLTWDVTGVRGIGPYEYQFLLYKDDQLIESTDYSDDNSKTFVAGSIGVYHCVILVEDKGLGNQKDFKSTPVPVSAWPASMITKVETVNGTALKITWAPVKGAQRYELYRAANKAGPYRLVKATTAASLIDAHLVSGVQYFYKLRFLSAQGKWSPLSNYVTGVPIAKPVIISAASPASRQVRLLWSKAAGASGYQVLLSSTPAGPYRVVRTLPGTAVAFSGLKKGSRLCFQVRPYRKVYSTVYYGAVSDYRAIKVK